MKYIEGLGLVVGDMRGNTLGQNALLDANGMCVRNNNSEIVRFGITDIKVVNEDGDPIYNGTGSVVKSQNNIVVSTQQTKMQAILTSVVKLHLNYIMIVQKIIWVSRYL